MRKISVYLPDPVATHLLTQAKELDIKVSELVRRLLVATPKTRKVKTVTLPDPRLLPLSQRASDAA